MSSSRRNIGRYAVLVVGRSIDGGVFNPMQTEERFWSKVGKSSGDCWLWTGGRDAAGYGIFYVSQEKHILAHCYAFEHEYRPIPPDKRLLAECENDLCVRPLHMRLATPSEVRRGALQDVSPAK